MQFAHNLFSMTQSGIEQLFLVAVIIICLVFVIRRSLSGLFGFIIIAGIIGLIIYNPSACMHVVMNFFGKVFGV